MNISALTSSLSPGAIPDGAARRAASTPEGDRKKVSQQFEAILVRQLLSKSVGNLLGGDSVAGSVYGDMMTDSLAQKLTAGPGLGLGRIIEKQLTPRGTPVAAETKGVTP